MTAARKDAITAPVLHSYELDDTCYKVRLLAACLGLDLTIVAVDAFPGRQHLSSDYLMRNPAGGLPILEDGSLTIAGAEPIMLHLAGSAAGGERFLPHDPVTRSMMMHWLFFAHGPLAVASQARAASMMGTPGDPDALRAEARRRLRVMDDHMVRAGLTDETWFVGTAPSLADFALFPAFALSRDFNIDHDEFAALRAWARRVRRLDGFITMPGIPDYH